MADNTVLDAAVGTGDTIRDKDRAGVKTQIVGLDVGIGGSESLMTAAALADATANPTLPAWASMAMLYNGTTWDRMRGDTANGLDVDVTRLPAVTGTGTFAVQDSEKVVDNAAFTDGTTKVMPNGYIFDEVAGTALTENDAAAARIDSKRAQIGVIEDATTRGQRAAVSAANALKVDGSAVTQPVSLATLPVTNAGTFAVQNAPQAQTTGGLTIGPASAAKLLSAASTNATSVKASAGQVYGWYLYNSNAAVRFVKLYNKASAPTVGTDVPVMVIPIPPGAAANVEYHMGIIFATGIALATTTGVADADSGAVAANEIVINLLFK